MSSASIASLDPEADISAQDSDSSPPTLLFTSDESGLTDSTTSQRFGDATDFLLAASAMMVMEDKRLPNPLGKNQYAECPPKTCPTFKNLLREYHRISTNRDYVSELLIKEHGYKVSGRTVARRWKDMGLRASRATENELPKKKIIELVIEQMNKDPEGRMGQNVVKQKIAQNTGIHLKRNTVAKIQKTLDPQAYARRNPKSRQIRRVPLTSDGPNEVWCCDGHDKLCKYGFAIWGIRDKFSRKWLGLWVMPNNRLGDCVAYLWLKLVRKIGGLPKQTSTDCGSENTIIYGLANALQAAFNPDNTESPAHVFLRSVHHTPIERGWLDLRKDFGHNFQYFWGAGFEVYEESNLTHQHLLLWLWPPLIQKELDEFMESANNRRVRKQKDKILPSGVSPNTAYIFPEKFNAVNCLQPVDVQIVDGILQELERGRRGISDWGVPEEFAQRAHQGYIRFGSPRITISNIWLVFSALLPYVS